MSTLVALGALLALVQDPAASPIVVESTWRPLPLAAVRLLDGPLRTSTDAMHRYLLEVDPARLLHAFRRNAGLPSDAEPLGGWEAPDCELRGHFVGHYLSACAEMWEATGDVALRDRAMQMVGELQRCQQELGGGYLSAFPATFFDRLENGERVWAPWYTEHKVLQGLLDVHRRCADERALAVAVRFADWIDARIGKLDDAAMQKTLDVEFGGMPDALAALYAVTGEPRHLALAKRFRHDRIVGRLARGGDPLRDVHANTQVPKALAEARLYTLTGDDEHRRAATRFFDLVARGRCYPTGGTSSYEYWRRPPFELAADLGPETAENCVTHNLRKLADRLFAQTGDTRYADWSERALWNGILGTHHPDDAGSIMYYVPLLGGLFRHYSPKESSFVCCSGTGMESFATLGDGIWWEDGTRLAVTQFVASHVRWPRRAAEFELRTSFPDEPRVTIRAVNAAPADLTVRVRLPAWARAGDDSTWLDLAGPWQAGEERTVALPMALHTEALPDEPRNVAVLYGPIVLAARLGTTAMDAAMIDGRHGDAYRMATEGAALPAPTLAIAPDEAPEQWLAPVANHPLTFRTRAAGGSGPVEFVPFHRLHGERYAVFVTLGGRDWQPAPVPTLPDGVVDQLACGDAAARRAHEFQAYRWNEGTLDDGAGFLRSRYWLRFDMHGDPTRPLRVVLGFATDDAGTPYEVLVDGVPVARTVVPHDASSLVTSCAHELPLEHTRGKPEICIKVRALAAGEKLDSGDAVAAPGPNGPTTPRLVTLGIEVVAPAKALAPTVAATDDHAPIVAVPFTDVHPSGFLEQRIRTSREHTIPHALAKCDARIRNFERAAGLRDGGFEGSYPFDDSDVYKVLEGISYHLARDRDAQLEARLDEIIAIIAKAQEADGYLYTARQLRCERLRGWFGAERWSNLGQSHELYNAGHLFEAAAAHFQATGKRTLLDVATRLADLIDRDFGPDARRDPPGHPEIEIGLASLYRVTGEARYLELARFLIEQRGATAGRHSYGEYAQDHAPILEQTTAVGHAVRAAYLYTGMADVAALSADQRFVTAIDRIWDDVVGKKLYVTGGIGATGAGEAFGAAYELPNASAYCETCAAIANVNWNLRMFLRSGDARYLDVLERALYNNVLAGCGLDGESFFYPNPLASFGSGQRSAWFGCACCPSNLARFVPSVGRFVAATRGDHDVYLNLYESGSVDVHVGDAALHLRIETGMPWNGDVRMVLDLPSPTPFTLRLRIPGWAREAPVPSDLYRFADGPAPQFQLLLGDEPLPYRLEAGYAVVERTWLPHDRVTLRLPMPVRKLVAHPSVQDDVGRVALERGPLVYCVEGHDVADGDGFVPALVLDPGALLEPQPLDPMLGGIVALAGTARVAARTAAGVALGEPVGFRAIPYYAWAHRGPTTMAVWLARDVEHAIPAPAPTLAYRSRVTASHNQGLAKALADQMEVTRSGDKSRPFFHWWPKKGSVEWIQYEFPAPATVDGSEVFWMFDVPHGECDPPQSWRILYRDDAGGWQPVAIDGGYPITRDGWDRVRWTPVTTTALRLEVTLQERLSTGLHEWRVAEVVR